MKQQRLRPAEPFTPLPWPCTQLVYTPLGLDPRAGVWKAAKSPWCLLSLLPSVDLEAIGKTSYLWTPPFLETSQFHTQPQSFPAPVLTFLIQFVPPQKWHKSWDLHSTQWYVVLVAQSWPTLCDPKDCSPLGPLSMGFSRQEYRSGCHFLL